MNVRQRVLASLVIALCLPALGAGKPVDNQKWIEEVRASIKGKENLPAPEVFQNIQFMKKTPAGRLLAIMDIGYSKALGVGCDHCHIPEMWDDDSKAAKGITREMNTMTSRINKELLPAIAALQDREPLVNCTTCHRGALRPALDIVGDPK